MTSAASLVTEQLFHIEDARARAALYNCFAAAFGDPPMPDLVAVWVKMLPRPVAGALWARTPVPLDELRQAYTRLLVGPGTGYAPPYASVYLNPPANAKPQLWGPEATAVEALYHQAGLEIAPGQPRVPDHLAYELQFVQHLCAREADAERRGAPEEATLWREHQHTFLRDHLWPWLPRFAGRVSDASVAAHPLYRGLVDLLAALVRHDLDWLENCVEPARVPSGRGARLA